MFLDGEMTGFDIKDRLNTHKIENDNVSIRCCSDYRNARNNLLDESFRKDIEDFLTQNDIKIIIIDNKTSLCPGIDENSKGD